VQCLELSGTTIRRTNEQTRRKKRTVAKLTGIDSSGEDESGGDKSIEKGRSASVVAKKSLLEAIDDAGLSLKPRAEKAVAKLALAESRGRKLRYLIQTCLLYLGFITYRAYRGFFVILPAVFRRVYERLERAVDGAPFDGDGNSEAGDADAFGAAAAALDADPATGQVRWRTRVTVSVLAFIVTASYVVGGAIRVAARFASSLLKTSDVSESLQAAAREQEENESKILRRLTIAVNNASLDAGKVNGTTSRGSSRDSADDERPDGSTRYSDLAP
jgi:hypothetical protein